MNNIFISFNNNKVVREFLATLSLNVLFLFVCSQVSFDIGIVPITMQSLGVSLISLKDDCKVGVSSIITYLMLGALGLPIFANFSGGLHVLFGPTGGYLFGFFLSILVVSNLSSKFSKDNIFKLMFLVFISNILVFIPGILYLSGFIGIGKAFSLGFIPFIIPGIFKIIILVSALRLIKKED